MRVYVQAVAVLCRLGGVLAMLLLATAVLVVSQMVVIRYFLGASTVWQTEYVIYATTGAMLLGAPYVLLLRGHVGVDILQQAARPRMQRVMRLTAALASMCFIAALAWSGAHFLAEAIERHWTTDTVWKLPLWIPFWPLPVAMILMLLQYISEILMILNPRLEYAVAHAATEHARTHGEGTI